MNPPSCSSKEWRLALFRDLKERLFKSERTVSIVIQGPLHERSIKTIPEYLKYGEVVVSCWDKDNLNLLEESIN